MIRKLTPKDYTTASWSGGTTTQIGIFPPEARYGDRDFLWRVSSARVELEESDFTPLPDYDRYIATLEGEILLTHNGGGPIPLKPLQVHRFSGGDRTRSRGRCTDFNLMLRRGRAEGSLEVLSPDRSPQALTCGPGETLVLYCARGSCALKGADGAWECSPGEALLATGPRTLTLSGPAALLVCRIRLS